MSNNPDVPPIALCAFRNEADSDECNLRTHRDLKGQKCQEKAINGAYPVSFHPLPTQLTGCVLVLEAVLGWCCTNAQENKTPIVRIYPTLKS